MSAKILEAQELVKAAEKMLRTSILRWNPDYDNAADLYSQAAQCYRIAKEMKLSMQCHTKAAESYKQNRSYFHAAKAMENAIVVGRDIAGADEIYRLACQASNFYQQHGSGDSGAAVLAKTAKILEETEPEKACMLYQKAADSSFAESSTHSAAEFISKASRIFVKLEQYDKAAESVREEVRHQLRAGNYHAVGRLVVCAVLVQVARGDAVEAAKAFREWGMHCELPEHSTVESMIEAMEESDGAMMRSALSSPFVRSMDVEYSRLAASLQRRAEGAQAAAASDADQPSEGNREEASEAINPPGTGAGGSLC